MNEFIPLKSSTSCVDGGHGTADGAINDMAVDRRIMNTGLKRPLRVASILIGLAALFSAGSLRYLRLRLRQWHRAEIVGFNAQRPVRLGVVILVSDMRRQFDDLAFREQPIDHRPEPKSMLDRNEASIARGACA